MRLALLLVTFPLWLCADSYSIGGIVVQHGTGVPHARVSISPLAGQRTEVSAYSGKEGQFSFSGLAAGKYSLTAEFRGRRQMLQEHEGFSTAIVAGPGLDSGHIVFALDGVSALRGTVRDEAGDPVGNAQFSLFQRALVMGRSQIKLVSTGVTTDATGEFRFRNLKPGTYFLAAQGRPWFAQYQPRSSNENQLDAAYPLTYYADSTNPAEATPIPLTEGAAADVHLTLRATPALHIKIEGEADAVPQIFHYGLGGIEIPVFGTVFYGSQDIRELSGLTPGIYSVRLQKLSSGRLQQMGKAAIALNSDTTISADELPKLADPVISGTVALADGAPTPGVAVWLKSVAIDGAFALSDVEPSGAFHVDPNALGSRPPGRYELQLSNGLYLKSVSVKGADYSRGELEVGEGAQIQLAITAGKAEDFSGVVTKEGQPFGGAMVLLVPRDFSHGAAIPRDQSDSDGTFQMTSVAPGSYTLLAIEEPGELAYHDPAAIAAYLKQGRTLQLPLAPDTQTKVEVQRPIP